MMLENIDRKFRTELKQLLLYLDKIDPRENRKNIAKIEEITENYKHKNPSEYVRRLNTIKNELQIKVDLYKLEQENGSKFKKSKKRSKSLRKTSRKLPRKTSRKSLRKTYHKSPTKSLRKKL
jgi:hypothetical protein